MSTRSMLFFMQQEEFKRTLVSILDNGDKYMILRKYWSEPIFLRNKQDINDSLLENHKFSPNVIPNEIYFLEKTTEPQEPKKLIEEPGRYGIVLCNTPIIKDNSLYLIQLGAKSDWYNAEERKVYNNPDVFKFYDEIKRFMRKQLIYPVYIYSKTDIVPILDKRNIGYTAGVAKFVAEGGTLAQEGVANIGFSLKDSL